jgi:hypothetical protein
MKGQQGQSTHEGHSALGWLYMEAFERGFACHAGQQGCSCAHLDVFQVDTSKGGLQSHQHVHKLDGIVTVHLQQQQQQQQQPAQSTVMFRGIR